MQSCKVATLIFFIFVAIKPVYGIAPGQNRFTITPARLDFWDDSHKWLLATSFGDDSVNELNRQKSLPVVRFITQPAAPDRNTVFVSPIIGYNLYDGFMAGMGLFNAKISGRPTTFSILPLWGISSNSLAGQFSISHQADLKNRFFKGLQLGLHGRRHALPTGVQTPNLRSFQMMSAFVRANVRLPEPVVGRNASVFVRSYLVRRYQPVHNSSISIAKATSYLINQIGLDFVSTVQPAHFHYSLKIEQGNDFIKTTGQAKFFRTYNETDRGVFVRIFGGAFLLAPRGHSQVDYRLRLGAHRGLHDYTFSNFFFGRSERAGTVAGNQIVLNDGGFSFPTPVGQNWNWLAAVNVKADLPVLPFRLFFDFGTYHHAADAFVGSLPWSWVAGVHFEPIRDVLRINFPVAVSADIDQVANFAFDTYIQKITYSVNLERLNFSKFFETRRIRDLLPARP